MTYHPILEGSLPGVVPVYLQQTSRRPILKTDTSPMRARLTSSSGLSACADIGDDSGISPVGVDTDTRASSDQGDVVKDDMTLIRSRAVSAGAVKLAKVVGVEVGDRDRTGTVVLEDLVLCNVVR